jgi:hypothetical protein
MLAAVFPFARTQLLPRLAKTSAPRRAPAAVRVPDPRQLQVSLEFPSGTPQIFVHEGARLLLERRISTARARVGEAGPVFVRITDNCRRMLSVARHGRPASEAALEVRLHHMFLDAPVEVHEALARYVVDGDDRVASALVGKFIDAHSHRIRAVRPVSSRVRPRGAVHDLLAIFHRVNATYFGGSIDALITWGRAPKRRTSGPRKAIKLGSYSATERLIRVHPVLDRAWVPRYFVAFVVFHEMLHHVVPAIQGAPHPPEFQDRERAFRDYERAVAWERAHLARLLRA